MAKKAEAQSQSKMEWSQFVKQYAAAHSISYKQALTQCRDDYYKHVGKTKKEALAKKPRAEKPKKLKEVDEDEEIKPLTLNAPERRRKRVAQKPKPEAEE